MIGRWGWLVLRVGFAVVACTVAVFPFLWMLRTSAAAPHSIIVHGMRPLPGSYDFSNYTRAWRQASLGSAMLNGAIVTVTILLLQLLTCIPAAYAFAKLRFRGRTALYFLVLACLLVPTQATALPLFLGISQLGFADTRAALIVPFATSAFGLFLLRQHMLTIPDALLDAARSDGLGTFSILRRVIVPASAPAIATFSLLSIFFHWNDYLWPLLIAHNPQIRTPPLALAIFQQDTGYDFGALAAGAVIISVPIVLLFLGTQRFFVAGIASGELPG